MMTPTRVRRGLFMIVGVIGSFALATNSMAATQIGVKNPGGLTVAGPVNSEYGFPSWYEDSNKLRLEPCLDGDDPLCGFLPGDIPNPDAPISFPDNFPDEFFLPGGERRAGPAGWRQGGADAGPGSRLRPGPRGRR